MAEPVGWGSGSRSGSDAGTVCGCGRMGALELDSTAALESECGSEMRGMESDCSP